MGDFGKRSSSLRDNVRSEGKRRKTSGDTMEDPKWSVSWEPVLRKSAIKKGLDQVFKLSQNEDNFNRFGNDIIQCFYDVGIVSGAPVRGRCLKYVEQLAHRYKHSVMTRGWKREEEPTPDEVIQAAIGMYCMERVGVAHDLKEEVQAFIALNKYSALDYFGWDPVEGPPPKEGHKDENGPITIYRAMSNSLIHAFYAERAGLCLGASYKDIFQHLHLFRPWSGPETMSPQEYTDQSYLVTHVVFTLNNWGELMLDKDLCPHEYSFARNHLALQIDNQDVHLVAELIEVLRCFGVDDDDRLLRAGMAFLLSRQNEEGLWDADAEIPYHVYHATMVGIQALLSHNFRGYGPGITSVESLMIKWCKDEVENKTAIIGKYSHATKQDTPTEKKEEEETESESVDWAEDPRIASMKSLTTAVLRGNFKGPTPVTPSPGGTPSSTSTKPSKSSSPRLPTSSVADSHSLEVTKAANIVRDLETSSSSVMRQLLTQASDLTMTLRILQETGIGKAIKKAGKRTTDPDIKKRAEGIVAKWKATFA